MNKKPHKYIIGLAAIVFAIVAFMLVVFTLHPSISDWVIFGLVIVEVLVVISQYIILNEYWRDRRK